MNYEWEEHQRPRAESWQWDRESFPVARKMVSLSQVVLHLSFSLCSFCPLSISLSLSLLHTPPRQETMPAVPKSPVSPPGSADLSSHMAERPRPGHSGAAAAGEEKHPRTECLSPFSRGRAHLQGGERSGLGPWRPLGHLPLPPQSVWGLT